MQGGINNAGLFGASQREARSKLDQMAGIKRPNGILASSPELMQAAAGPAMMQPPPQQPAPMPTNMPTVQPALQAKPMPTTVAPMAQAPAPRSLNPMAPAPAAGPGQQPVVKLAEGGEPFRPRFQGDVPATAKMTPTGVDITQTATQFMEDLDKKTDGALTEKYGSLEAAEAAGDEKMDKIQEAAKTEDAAAIADAAVAAVDEEVTDAAKMDFAENIFGLTNVNDIDEINRRIANVAIGSAVGKGPDKFAEAVLFGLQTMKQTAAARAAGAAGAGGEKSRQEYLYKSVFDATYKAALEVDPENPEKALADARTAAQTAAPNAPSASMGGQPAAAPAQTPLQQVQEALQLEPQRREEILKQATDMGIDVKGL